MRIGVIEIEHSVDCKACGYTARAGTSKRMWLKMAIHMKFRCPVKHPDIHFLKVLWELFWIKLPY